MEELFYKSAPKPRLTKPGHSSLGGLAEDERGKDLQARRAEQTVHQDQTISAEIISQPSGENIGSTEAT